MGDGTGNHNVSCFLYVYNTWIFLHIQPTSNNIYNLEATKYQTNRHRCGFLYQLCLNFVTLEISQFSPLLQTLHVGSAKMSSGSCKPSDCVDSDDRFSNKFTTINGKTHVVENNHQMTVALSGNYNLTSDILIQLKALFFLVVVACELSWINVVFHDENAFCLILNLKKIGVFILALYSWTTMTYFAILSIMPKLFIIICNVLYIVYMGNALLHSFFAQQYLAYETYIELIYLIERYNNSDHHLVALAHIRVRWTKICFTIKLVRIFQTKPP